MAGADLKASRHTMMNFQAPTVALHYEVGMKRAVNKTFIK